MPTAQPTLRIKAFASSRLKVRTRLLLGFGGMIAVALIIAGGALAEIHRLEGQLVSVEQINREQVDAIRQLQDKVSDAYVSMLSLGILTEEEELQDEAAILKDLRDAYDQGFAQLNQRAMANGSDPQLKEKLEAVAAAQMIVDNNANPIMPKLLAPGDRSTLGNLAINAIRTSFDGWQSALRQLAQHLSQRNAASIAAAAQEAQHAKILLASASLVALVVGLAASTLILRSILRPLNKAIQVADAVANGDLRHEIPVTSRDELGDLLRSLAHMQTSLRTLIGEVQGVGSRVLQSSEEIADGNLELNTRTEQTASQLQQLTALVEAITHSVQQTREAAHHTDEYAHTTAETAQQGGQAMRDAMQVMQAIESSSKKITDIISVIDAIAFQTNILALNAAVEAAQAGDHGRGFAVVASEVRALAQRSANAASEVRRLIQDSGQNVLSGVQTVQNAGRAMDQILTNIGDLTAMASQISEAVRVQSDKLGQLSSTVGQIDTMTLQNASMVEQATSSASTLQAEVRLLGQAVRVFRTDRLLTH